MRLLNLNVGGIVSIKELAELSVRGLLFATVIQLLTFLTGSHFLDIR
jgi:hypothetical protein